MRRNVRRGLQELTISALTSDQLLLHGVQPYCDTRRRVGLSDGTPEAFRRQFGWLSNCPAHNFIGAWKGDNLTAFLSITEVDDWAEIGCFSRDAFLKLRPNETLFFHALSHYMTERQCRLVSYGLSSIQLKSSAAGLHAFKIKVGFEARPVHRAFVLNPFLRPFANRLTLWGLKGALKFIPRERHLKKAVGVLAQMIENRSPASATRY
jgi:hypothetical protein